MKKFLSSKIEIMRIRNATTRNAAKSDNDESKSIMHCLSKKMFYICLNDYILRNTNKGEIVDILRMIDNVDDIINNTI